MTHEEFIERFQYDPIRDRIGSGGFGKVYKAWDKLRERQVAIKECNVDDHKFTLMREFELSNEVKYHPNITRFENCYRFNLMRIAMDYAVMEYYPEGNLSQVLEKYQLTIEDKTKIIRGILEGIAHLHQQKVIHRDLKPHNILVERVNQEWVPKIADFGLSRLAVNDHSISNSSIGISIAYAAPEQLQNRKIQANVDLWSFGVIVYQIMTGELPFSAPAGADPSSAQIEISKKIINVELPKKLSSLTAPFQKIITHCLVHDNKSERVQQATQLLNYFDVPINLEQTQAKNSEEKPIPQENTLEIKPNLQKKKSIPIYFIFRK